MHDAPIRTLADIGARIARLQNDQEAETILEEAEGMARVFAEMEGWVPPTDELLREGRSERARRCWYRTCASFSYLKGIDLEDLIGGASPRP